MKLPTEVTSQQLVIKHPDRDELVPWWQFYYDAVECKGGFGLDLKRVTLEGQQLLDYHSKTDRPCYLLKYSRESKEKFLLRTQSMYLLPYLKLKVLQPLIGFLTAKPPDRQGYPPALEEWLKHCTDTGQSFDDYMALSGIKYGLTYGRLPHVVDADQHDAATEDQRKAMGARDARLRTIHTTRLWDWAYDSEGQLAGIKYETDMSDWNMLDGHKQYKRYRWVTADGTWYVDQKEENKSGSGYHVSGAVPWEGLTTAPLAELSFMGGEGLIAGMSGMVLDLFNKLSQLNEVQTGSCFCPISYPKPKGANVPDAGIVGVLMVMPYDPEGGGKPEFMIPSMEPLNHLASWIDDKLVKWIQEVGQSSPILSAGAEAAATLAYRFQALERFLRALVKDIVDFEYRVCEIAAQWLNVPWDKSKAECVYAHTFDVLAIERLLEQLTVAKNDIGLPPTALKVGKRRIIDGMELWGTDEETAAIEEELEEEVTVAKTTRQPLPPQGDEGQDDGSGEEPPIPPTKAPEPPGEVRE